MLKKHISTSISLSLCLALFCIFSAAAHAQGSEIEILLPFIPTSELNKDVSPTQAAEPYVNRIGMVSFAADVFLPRTVEKDTRVASPKPFKGAALVISFFADKRFMVMVNHEARPKPEVLSLNGSIQGQDISTFSMTVTPESFLIFLQDLDTATVFRVVGDTESGLGRATEIDLRKMPPRHYLPPLIPAGE
jgi:hypothetical protein